MTIILNSPENGSHELHDQSRSGSAAPLAAAALGATLVTGCAATDDGEGTSVAAAFYPLAFVAERVADGHAEVTNLTSPGGEPHDLELTIKETLAVTDADLVVHLSGFQPAVDDIVDASAQGRVLDAADVVDLLPDPADDGADDPHFWLDPLLMADLGDAVAEELAELDPDHARRLPGQRRGAARRTWRPWTRRTPRGWPAASGTRSWSATTPSSYLERYGLTVEAINGLSPDAEPTPADLARLQRLVRRRGDHHRVLRDAGQPQARRDARRRPGHHHRRPRPDRGTRGQHSRRGLPEPGRGQPRRPEEGERLLSTPVVEVRDASVSLGGRPVLRRVDLTVHAGEFLALMGANGSGKSTMVRAMTGLWPLTGGVVSLFGVPLPGFTDWQRVGFVPQRAGAAGGVPASVHEVVASGRLTRRRHFRPLGRADRRAIDEAIEVVGLTEKSARRLLHALGRAAATGADRACTRR